MKKLILLALVVLVAGSAFAKVTPAITGKFEFNAQIDFTPPKAKSNVIGEGKPEITIKLNGVIDEWTSVNAKITAKSKPTADKSKENDKYLKLSNFTLTNNITGALGVNGPVGVAITFGYLKFEPEHYNKKAGWNKYELAKKTKEYAGGELVITIVEKVKVLIGLAPTTYSSAPVLSFEVQLLNMIEGLKVNVYYLSDLSDRTTAADEISQVGLSAGYTASAFDIGAAFAYDLSVKEVSFALESKVRMGTAFSAGLSLGAKGIGGTKTFLTQGNVGLNLTYKIIPDKLDVFVAVKVPFANIAATIGFEGGLEAKLGAVSYFLGYEHNTTNFKAPDHKEYDGVFFKVKAAF